MDKQKLSKRSQKTPNPVTIDFETAGIKPRPEYPPEPCGVSIKYPGKKAKYYAWGHSTNNNCTKQEAEDALYEAYQWPDGILCHNGKFDVDVAEVHMGMQVPHWSSIHDTLFLIFLDDPHQTELGLKPSAERILGWGQEDKDAVGEWLIKQQPVEGVKISKSKASEYYFMVYVHYAPGDLVGEYANSDVDKTEALFKVLWPDIKKRGMLEAYDRERRLMPCLLDMERRGVRVDVDKLRADIELYENFMGKIEAWVKKRIKAPYSINLDSSAELMDAMIASGVVDEKELILTPTGKVATNKDALLVAVNDKQLLSMLSYRAQLKTCLATFMKNWLSVAEKPESNGRIFCYFNQVRSDKGNDSVGARTGRLSGSPNFLNLPKEFKPWFHEHQKPEDRKAKPLPKSPVKGLPALPKCRSYILPFEGEILIGRDYSSQEIRMLAHLTNATMADAYRENPRIDLHQYAVELILKEAHVVISRYAAKVISFSILYGAGVGKLAESLGCTVDEAAKLKKAYLKAFPEIESLQKDLKQRGKNNQPYYTVGGRQYYDEPKKQINGRVIDFNYKATNFLCQGGSSDQTKEAVVKFYESGSSAQLILIVHDELVISSPQEDVDTNSKVLNDAMVNAIELGVPMLTDGERGFNWGEMSDEEI